jgi:hypothetical protein
VTVWDRPRLSSRYFINGEERLSVPIVVIRGTAIEMRLQASPLLPAGTLVEVWYQVGTGAWAKLTSRRVETATGFARYSFRAYKTSVAYRWRLPGSGPLPPVFSAARRIYAR